MKVTIIVNGIERNYKGDYNTMYNREWTEDVRELFDNVIGYETNTDPVYHETI